MATEAIQTRCCIAGGGPAGMMLGLLLARAGVPVVVLEKHADFLRDFRGDTLHPSTLEVMYELGLSDELLALPHQKVNRMRAQIGDTFIQMADLSSLKVHSPYIAFMPQWDFLNFIATASRRLPGYALRMRADVDELLVEDGRVVGVKASTPDGALEVRADLVVGCDGRHSRVRDLAGLKVIDLGAPIDVLWFALTHGPGDPEESTGHFDVGRIFVRIFRGSHWQCGYVIPKDGLDALKAKGLDAFRASVARSMPFAAARLADEITDWDQIKLLTIRVDRLETWHRPGLLCIGDAAHAMSPIGGVGINLAIQDAVAAANILAVPLRDGTLASSLLAQVQQRRMLPTRATQAMQLAMQKRIFEGVLGARGDVLKPPLALRLAASFPPARWLLARILGLGVRPEHVASPAAKAA